ncbi:MAG: TolC family protein, partial [Epsilonproteobacteria bacterium]|nr:TolC family protein [Campylobacterota bacterium]
MKKLFLLFSITLTSLFAEEELSDILSDNKSQLLEQQKEQTQNQTSQLEKSWVNPIVVQYSKNYSSQFPDTIGTGQFVISVDQPIFKMGGIWAAIKYAKALGKANEIEI